MSNFLSIVGIIFLFSLFILILVPLATAFGALAGWATEVIFPGLISGTLTKIGITGVETWQFGAFLGFVGAFLKPQNLKK